MVIITVIIMIVFIGVMTYYYYYYYDGDYNYGDDYYQHHCFCYSLSNYTIMNSSCHIALAVYIIHARSTCHNIYTYIYIYIYICVYLFSHRTWYIVDFCLNICLHVVRSDAGACTSIHARQ